MQRSPALIQGLRTRDEAAALLAHSPPGTFVVRLTENYLNALALSFVDEAGLQQNLLMTMQKYGARCNALP